VEDLRYYGDFDRSLILMSCHGVFAMKYNIIDSFFTDPSDCVKFCAKLRKLSKVAPDSDVIATLFKIDQQKWGYSLTWTKDPDIAVAEFIKPFKPNRDNVNKFNRGCEIIARELEVFIDTRDPSKISVNSKPFGDLTYRHEFRDPTSLIDDWVEAENTFLQNQDEERHSSDSLLTDWVLIDEPGGDGKMRTYVDNFSIKQRGSVRLAWVKMYADPPARDKINDLDIWELLTLYEFDCAKRMLRGHKIVFHYEHSVGDPLSVQSDWAPITTKSQEILLNYVCQYECHSK